MLKNEMPINKITDERISLLKRLSACLYELLILLAIWMLTAFIFLQVFGDVGIVKKTPSLNVVANIGFAYKRYALQLSLWLASGAYFVWCWCKSGQTPATQAWKMRLVNESNHLLSLRHAMIRYVLASLSFLVGGIGFLWALVDKNQYFLHDRLLKTHFIVVNKV